MGNDAGICQEDIIYKQLCNLNVGITILKCQVIKKHPSYNALLSDFNSGCDIVFNNIANMREMKEVRSH